MARVWGMPGTPEPRGLTLIFDPASAQAQPLDLARKQSLQRVLERQRSSAMEELPQDQREAAMLVCLF
jgi:hypothetical protein